MTIKYKGTVGLVGWGHPVERRHGPQPKVDSCTFTGLRMCPVPSCELESGCWGGFACMGSPARLRDSLSRVVQGVSLTAARECGQLVFLEGLKSSVDVFFRAQAEPHPLQFLRSVSPHPCPEVPSGWGGYPDQACSVIPCPWHVACEGTELPPEGRRFPGVVASSESPWLMDLMGQRAYG